jgi:hypothetical protein
VSVAGSGNTFIVTAVAPGTTTVSFTDGSGHSAAAAVTVTTTTVIGS